MDSEDEAEEEAALPLQKSTFDVEIRLYAPEGEEDPDDIYVQI